MYIIKPTRNKQFRVSMKKGNGEILSSTETFKTKQSAYKNIAAQGSVWDGESVFVEDRTFKPSKYINFFIKINLKKEIDNIKDFNKVIIQKELYNENSENEVN